MRPVETSKPLNAPTVICPSDMIVSGMLNSLLPEQTEKTMLEDTPAIVQKSQIYQDLRKQLTTISVSVYAELLPIIARAKTEFGNISAYQRLQKVQCLVQDVITAKRGK